MIILTKLISECKKKKFSQNPSWSLEGFIDPKDPSPTQNMIVMQPMDCQKLAF